MTTRFSVISLCLLLSVTGAAEMPTQDAEKQFDAQLEELKTSVYCYCGCEKMTIQICDCGTGQAIENEFRQRLSGGETVEQIIEDYLDEHGPQYYALMPAEGINLIAYIMPAVILILIGGIFLAVLRKLTTHSRPADQGDTADSTPSHETIKQIESELEKYKRQR